jgi:propanol-preferring alcohol dehydrogenase
MLAMTLSAQDATLVAVDIPIPALGADDVLLQVLACGVCRTDLHIVDGELPRRMPGLVPGHEVVGRVLTRGANVHRFEIGDRVGVPYLGGSCHHCPYCQQA